MLSGGEFETNITRFTLLIRSLAFIKSGTMLAATDDDEGIKLINTIDGSVARVLKGHRGSVTGISFDPKGEYLASVDSVGTVIYWELHNSGIIAHNLKCIAPPTSSDSSIKNLLQWSPDGEMLAVPGLKNDVVMYDRDTAEKLFTLRGDHVQPVCFLSWSLNGKYMATSGLDRQILIWNVDHIYGRPAIFQKPVNFATRFFDFFCFEGRRL
ncbi:WD repeat and HMG-box DNA-binding protein 1-like [Heracleum sosnowskyi]|uniref:WD repeat and HMG-box DNA-binding protein 1-like n=1 Tax=Heracleum sosnowskyi TaxID=360622 RepID=A0AAD8I8I6_9APIA|nr:WD repeat and HMG-box DNA-binding protein 1-like [Heracleum sosnowskyi]